MILNVYINVIMVVNIYTKKERTGTNGMDRTPDFIYFPILKTLC